MKVITIKDEVYEELVKIKGNKSFSEIIMELIKKEKNYYIIDEFKGIAKDSKFFSEIEEEILKDRKEIRSRI